MSNERDELAEVISGIDGPATLGGLEVADTILAAGYRKAEPVWEANLLNDGVFEYTKTSTCDGSTVYNYRRLPRLQYEGEFPSWESYVPEASK